MPRSPADPPADRLPAHVPPGEPERTDWRLVDFLLQLRADQAAGVVRPLGDYLASHPGHEVAIAREYLLVAALDGEPAGSIDEPRRFGDFVLLGELGRGGEGVVHRARDLLLGRDVALKVFRRDGGELAAARVLRAASAVAALEHPALVPVHGAGRLGGELWIAAAYVDGHSLASELERRRAQRTLFAPRQVATMLAAVARGLHHAHERGVVHRDVKPGNILLDRDGRLRLCDFGLARGDDGASDLTLAGELLGTPAYMAPEQLLAGSRAPAVDVWALGVVACECATLDVPFRGPTTAATMARVAELDLAAASGFAALPPALRAVLLTATAKDPLRRYATAAALADDLERFAAGEPVLALPPGPWTRLRTWARRRRRLALGLSTAAATLVVGLLTALAFLWRERDLRLQATASAAQTREVARAILFERTDALGSRRSDLATRVRLVQQAAEALQRLAADAPDDRRLQVELCIAWTRLGDLHGHRGDSNLGDPDAARRCWAIAAAAARGLRDEPRRDGLLAGLLLREAELRRGEPETDRLWFEVLDAVGPVDREARTVRGAARLELAVAARDRDELERALELVDAARTELAVDADDRDTRILLFSVAVVRASVLAELGDPAAGEAVLRAELPQFASRGPEAEAQSPVRARVDSTLANCVLMQGRGEEARALFAAAVERCRVRSRRDEADAGARLRLGEELRIQANALRGLGDHAAAAAAEAEGVALTPVHEVTRRGPGR
jgi:hypothetical protein